MPATQPRQFRLTDLEIAAIDALGRDWGGTIEPLSRTGVIRELVRREMERRLKAKDKKGAR